MNVGGWGNYPIVDANIVDLEHVDISSLENFIPRGMGRSYGDSSLSSNLVSMLKHNRILSFDNITGEIKVESGVTLSDIVDVFAPMGWFPAVTPGSKLVTIGGMVASDVHGKNHHLHGSFGKYVLEINLLQPSGNILKCNLKENSDVFLATIGGMGLTGVILDVKFRLIPIETSYIRQETLIANNLDELMDLFESSHNCTYSVAWVDCLAEGKDLGKSVLFLGEHAKIKDIPENNRQKPLIQKKRKQYSIPFFFPSFFLNYLTIKIFNFIYFSLNSLGKSKSVVSLDTFFYPLDAIIGWNKLYGKKGFIQYQFCLPKKKSKEVLKKILVKISKNKSGSFLAVLKLLGRQQGCLSFPQEGYTLALDFPFSQRNLKLLDELDLIVHDNGGRVYLTKDARLSSKNFARGYPRIDDFIKIKKKVDPKNRILSLQWIRLQSRNKKK